MKPSEKQRKLLMYFMKSKDAEIERLRGLVKSAYMEGFTSSKPWRDEDDYWNTSRAKMEIEKEVNDDF